MKLYSFFILMITYTGFSQNRIHEVSTFKGEHYALYTKCGSAITFCEITQQTYTSCGSTKNCYGLYVMPGDTFYVNIEDKTQSQIISADISFGGYFPAITSFIFKPIDNNCIPQQALQIAIPLNAVPNSSFQIIAQNTAYVNDTSQNIGVPPNYFIFVGGQQPQFTFALSNFTICPTVQDVAITELIMNNETLMVYPSPTNNTVNIDSKFNLQRIELFNIKDQVLFSEKINSKTYTLQLQNFAEGVYFMKITYSNGVNVTKKVIKQ